MNVFIGGAWPYANGSLHIGHIASLLPGDVLARYYRLNERNSILKVAPIKVSLFIEEQALLTIQL